jgi:predicted metal-dependent peptidase
MMGLCTEKAAVRLTVRYPFWCELFYSMNIIEVGAGHELVNDVQTLATDGKNLWVNVDYFNAESLDFQVADLVHELGHKMFLHATRRGFRDPQLWNQACDYAINSLLKQNGFAMKDPNRPDSDFLYDPQYDGWLAEKIYADLVNRNREQNDPPPPMPQKRMDLRKPEGTAEEIAVQEQEIQALVDRAIQNARARGDLPGGVEDGTAQAYRAVGESWFNHLHRYMQSLSSGNYNWAHLNRRTLRTHGCFSPMHLSEALQDVVIWVDGSGSCFSKAEQANFAAHVNAIMAEAKPRKVVVYYFDTRVYDPEEYEPGEVVLKPKGGGGSDCREIFNRAIEDGYHPSVGIVLTDMLVRFPDEEPPFPVFWADVLGAVGEAPFGEYAVVEGA